LILLLGFLLHDILELLTEVYFMLPRISISIRWNMWVHSCSIIILIYFIFSKSWCDLEGILIVPLCCHHLIKKWCLYLQIRLAFSDISFVKKRCTYAEIGWRTFVLKFETLLIRRSVRWCPTLWCYIDCDPFT